MIHATQRHTPDTQSAGARSAEFLRSRRADRLRAVRRGLSDDAQMDPGADRLCPHAQHHCGADQPGPRRRTGGCRAQQATCRGRRPDRRHCRSTPYGLLAERTACPGRTGAPCILKLRADAGDCRDQPASGRPRGTRRAIGAQRALRRNRQRTRCRGDGRDGHLRVQPKRVPADGGAVRTRAPGIARDRARAAREATDDNRSFSTGQDCGDYSPIGNCWHSPSVCCCSTCRMPRCCPCWAPP